MKKKVRIVTRLHKELFTYLQEYATAHGVSVTKKMSEILDEFISEGKEFHVTPLAKMYILRPAGRGCGEVCTTQLLSLYVRNETQEKIEEIASAAGCKRTVIYNTILSEFLLKENLLR